ncbi:hypothetical protein WJX81_007401 [Elliptochloris bilobata]|uniref:N-acetyltransferase domain-containing protein n=1 Tax=Elliptochloris bilobata TaxID=381761 RepID=A0AAW1S1P0_9CHLO
MVVRSDQDGPEALSYSDVSKFLTSLLAVPPEKAQVLVARLAPTDTTLLPAGRTTRLVGTAGISIDPAEREFFGPFQVRPPDTSVYLSNMAVDARFRRQGIAQLLLAACEQAAAAAGRSNDICLIVNQANDAAQALYQQAG